MTVNPSPRRPRPLLAPVAVATLVLSIVAAAVGLFLGQQAAQRRSAAGPSPAPAVTATTGPPCRPETQTRAARAGASGSLHRLLLLRTRTSVVYICADAGGRLYYHANSGGAEWEEGRTALFLTGVERTAEGFRVTAADGTRFSVDGRRLFIVHADGREETQPAVR